MRADIAEGVARLEIKQLEIEDYHDLNNALNDGPSVEAVVDVDIRWSGGGSPMELNNPGQGFRGDFIEDQARVAFTGRTDTFAFVSDPAGTSHNEFSVIGEERNGVFFRD